MTELDRWVYIIEGCFSTLVAVIVFFGLPNDPTKAWFLNAEEREMMRNEVSRESAVMRLLTAVWMPVAELVEKIEKNRQQAFQYRLSDGKPLKPNGLRKLVHVALRKLEELGQIEIEMVEGPRGPVGMARKIDLHSDLENDPENLPAAYDFLHREA